MTKKSEAQNSKANSKSKSQAKKQSSKVDKLEAHVNELTTDLQRLQADFANYKRRTEAEKSTLVEYGKQDAIKTLLPVIDNIERALSHTPKDIADNEWVQGVGKVKDLLMKDLAKLGVEKIKTVGESFDPELHEAVQMEEGDGDKEVVVEELRAGYMLNGSVLRHAMVKVGKE